LSRLIFLVIKPLKPLPSGFRFTFDLGALKIL